MSKMLMEFVRNDGASVEEPLEGIAPILKWTPRGLEILGTGFFVTSCGAMFTAAHIATQWEGDSNLFVFHKEFKEPGLTLRRVVKAIAHSDADVALLNLEQLPSATTQKPIRCSAMKVSTDIPPAGARVGCWGFPQSILLPPGGGYDDFTVLLERGSAVGMVEEHFPNGRDRVMQPGECIQTSMNTLGGASGGPVFNERGEVFAVVSSGIDEHTTYVAPIRDLALARILRVEPPAGSGEMVSLVEYLDRY